MNNLDKKILGELSKKESKVNVNTDDLHEVADVYRKLHAIKKACDTKMKKLAGLLKEKKAYEVFLEDEEKVWVQDGKEISKLNIEKLSKEVSMDTFVKMATTTEAQIKKVCEEENIGADLLIAQIKEADLDESGNQKKKADELKVSKLTKAEIKELNEKLLKSA